MKADLPAQSDEREILEHELRKRVAGLNDQSRIFIPLIGLAVIAGIPLLSRSPIRFLLLLVNPFVLLPVGFCLFHLLAAWRGISKVRNRIRDSRDFSGGGTAH